MQQHSVLSCQNTKSIQNLLPGQACLCHRESLFSQQTYFFPQLVAYAQQCRGLAISEIFGSLVPSSDFDWEGTADCVFDCVENLKVVVPATIQERSRSEAATLLY